MEYDTDAVIQMISAVLEEEGEDARPGFYAISGSHLYGFPSENGGDVDVRGFHLADGDRYWLLDAPREQYIVNQDGVREGYEHVEHVDLVSYELKKFANLLYKANFNVLEVVFEGTTTLNAEPNAIEELRERISEQLPLDVPSTYLGMAKSNFNRYLKTEGRGTFKPFAKKYLYVLRGVYAARYVIEQESICGDIRELVNHVDGDENLVDQLIAQKQVHEEANVPPELVNDAMDEIEYQFDSIPPTPEVDKSDYADSLDEWMIGLRQ